MAFKRRTTSNSQLKLQSRISSLAEVEPDFNLGQELDLASITTFIEELQDKRDVYNNTLAQADSLRDDLDDLEKQADDISERLYAGIIAQYGRDSVQYQQIGGIRKSKINYSGSRPETFLGAPEETSESGIDAT